MTARELVIRRLAAQVRRFPDLDLDALDTAGLDGRDAALARAIEFAVVSHWLTLRAVVASRLTRPWDGLDVEVRAALLVGAAQLLYLERVPAHAAIDEAVEITKRLRNRHAGGLVNAVLRAVARLRNERVDEASVADADVLPLPDGRAWRLTEPVFRGGALERLATQTSHPEQLLARWCDCFGETAATELALHDLVRAPIIMAGLDPQVVDDCPELVPHTEEGFAVFAGDRSALGDLLESHPGSRVQDPAAAAAVAMTSHLEPRLIVDACAGRGTKTMQLAATHPDARIVATDVHEGRREVLARSFRDHPRVSVVSPEMLAEHRGEVNLLLLDVPCSNTGVLTRRPEARYRLSADTLRSLIDVQRSIVSETADLLADDATLVYATCSLEPAENQEQAAWIGDRTGMKVATEADRRPRGYPGEAASRYNDGGYVALLTRRV